MKKGLYKRDLSNNVIQSTTSCAHCHVSLQLLDLISVSVSSKFFFTRSNSGKQNTGSKVMMLKPCRVTITIEAANIKTINAVVMASVFFNVALRLCKLSIDKRLNSISLIALGFNRYQRYRNL